MNKNHQLLINLAFLGTKYTGLTTYTKNLIPQLANLNPTLITSNSYPDFNTYPVSANLTQEQGTKGNIRRLIWTETQLYQTYQQLKSSLLFTPIPEAPIYGNCRYIVTVHDLIPLRFPKFSPLTFYNKYYLPQVLKKATHIIAVSQATASDINKFFNIPLDKITVILSGYDSHNFRPLNLATRPYFLYLGRYDPHKNLARLITAFSQIDPEYQLLIVGQFDPRFTPALQQQVEALSISQRVQFLNYVSYEELPQLLNQATALVYPSLWEGFGLPVLEAIACGTPVITSNLSSLPEVTGDAAILINPYSIDEMREAMQQIATDEQLRLKLKSLSRRRAELFSWEKTGQETATILESFL
jgi:glycosyltransferase involved in cell wall biosynthesis